MDLGPRDFDEYNETDVREEIIAPFLRHLGYRTGGEHNIRRELTLTYDRISLGRRKTKDPLLTGKADYICTAGGRVQWVIEAKPPREKLTTQSEEQAWTYANHPNVKAVYHCLTNGREFKVFQTSNGPEHPPIFACSYEELKERIVALESLLRPESVLAAFPLQTADLGEPLGPGLRSIVRIAGGLQRTTRTFPALPLLNELVTTIKDGQVERVDDRLKAVINTQSAIQALQELNEQFGLDQQVLFSDAQTISVNPEQPTEFSSSYEVVLPAGTNLLDIQNWKRVTLPSNITSSVTVSAFVYLSGKTSLGRFDAFILMNFQGRVARFQQSGVVEIYLS